MGWECNFCASPVSYGNPALPYLTQRRCGSFATHVSDSFRNLQSCFDGPDHFSQTDASCPFAKGAQASLQSALLGFWRYGKGPAQLLLAVQDSGQKGLDT